MICMLKALFSHKLINFHGRTSPVKCCASPTRKYNNSQGEAEFPIRYVIKYYESHWDAEMLSRGFK